MLPHRRKGKPETLTALLRLARASSAAAVTAVAVISSSLPPALAPFGVGGIVAGMKATFIALLAVLLCLPAVGAEKKKPGTVLWEFKTGHLVNSSPAIGSDGTV